MAVHFEPVWGFLKFYEFTEFRRTTLKIVDSGRNRVPWPVNYP